MQKSALLWQTGAFFLLPFAFPFLMTIPIGVIFGKVYEIWNFTGLGSAMTGYARGIWSYTQAGSALRTALLMVCSYAPYVICSIFAGALSERWDKKKTMLVCDTLAALSTLVVLFLAAIHLVASMYNAAFPAMLLSKAAEKAMGTVNTVIGITMLAGSILASVLKASKSRVKK